MAQISKHHHAFRSWPDGRGNAPPPRRQPPQRQAVFRAACLVGSATPRSAPIYLGYLGTLSLVFGFIAFEIIGLNMFASVGWDPIQFVRQLFWLGSSRRPAKYGLKILPPLARGRMVVDRCFFLTLSCCCGGSASIAAPANSNSAPMLPGLRLRDLVVPGARASSGLC